MPRKPKSSELAKLKSSQSFVCPTFTFWQYHRSTLDAYPQNGDTSKYPSYVIRNYCKLLDRLAEIEECVPESKLFEWYLNHYTVIY